MGSFKVHTTFNKSLGQTAPYAILSMLFFSTLKKQKILPITQKVMPIILTLFSKKKNVSYYSQLFWEKGVQLIYHA